MASVVMLPLVLGRSAHRLELAADRGRAGAGGFRDHPRDIAGALFGRGKRFVEQAGEARQALVEIGGAQVERGDQRFQLPSCGRRPTVVVVRLACSTTAAASTSALPCLSRTRLDS